jgi:hypothetical protein
MQTGWNQFVSAVLAGTVTSSTIANHVNVSYYSQHALLTPPVVDVIGSSVVESQIANQRRRVGR